MISPVKPEIVSLEPPETHAMPQSAYHVQRLGSLSLNWCNTEIVRLADPNYNHVLHHGSAIPSLRFPIPDRYAQQLIEKGFPFSTYPSMNICRFWTEADFALEEKPDTPEIDFQPSDRKLVLAHANTRLRTFRDTPEANHIEVRAVTGGRSETLAYSFADIGRMAERLFRDDFPMYTVPKLSMDDCSLRYHQMRQQRAA